MKTKAQALQDFADVVAEEMAIVSKLTAREAAERAWHRGGPSVEELTLQIEAARAEARGAPRTAAHPTRKPVDDESVSDEQTHEERWQRVEASVGKAVVAWSKLEFFIGMTFRAALSYSSPAVTAHLARSLSVNALLESLKVVATEYTAAESALIIDWVRECSRLARARNELFHGSYADQSDGVAWYPTIIRTSRAAGGVAPAHLEFERFDDAAVGEFVTGCGATLKAHATLPSALSGWVNSAGASA